LENITVIRKSIGRLLLWFIDGARAPAVVSDIPSLESMIQAQNEILAIIAKAGFNASPMD
jgi:hypothetical protein